MFDWIEVRTVGGMIIHRYLMILKKLAIIFALCTGALSCWNLAGPSSLLEALGALVVVRLMCCITGSTRVSRIRRYIFALTDFTMKGTKVPFCFPPKQPHTIPDTLCPFLTAIMQSFSHFSSGVRNTQICFAWVDFSIVHSSLQIVVWNLSTDQSFLSSAQARRLAARSSVSFGRLFAIHLRMPLSCRNRLKVLREAWGQHSWRTFSFVHVRLVFTVWRINRRSRLVSLRQWFQ